MKKVLKKCFMFLNNIFLFLLGILFSFIPERKTNKPKEEITKEPISKKKDNVLLRKKEEDDWSDEGLELFQEYLKKQKNLTITKEEIEEEFQKIMEKVYEIKVDSLTKEELEKLKNYQKKIIKKITTETISTKEELHEILKEKIKKEKEEILKKDPEEKLENKKQEEVAVVKQSTIENPIDFPINVEVSKEVEKKETPPTMLFQKEEMSREHQSEISLIPPKILKIEDLEKNKQEVIEDIPSISFEESKKEEQVVKEELEKKDVLKIEEEVVIKPTIEKEILQDISLKEEKIPETYEEKKTNNQEIKEEKKELKEEKKYEEINHSILTLETEELIKESRNEIEKEELEEKEYETVEQKIEDRIEFLEKLLEKTLKEETKKKVKEELERMRNLKKQIKLSKDVDLENTRLSLEEGISLEELEMIKGKLKELENQNEQEKQEAFLKLQYKSAEEINKLEKEIIKNTFHKTIKRLQIPLFLSFPFIKNKYFRSFVSGLFVFSSFHFLKRMLFGVPKQNPIDLSYLKTGHDALKESILLTKNNMASLKNLKEMTFLKYPELKNDEEFLLYLNEMERTLKMNYEKLLKQEKTVNKYFDKTKNLTRKLKREYRV